MVWLALGAAHAAQLTVEVHGLREARGLLLVHIYADARGFPTEPRRATARLQVAATAEHDVVRASLAPGRYAVAVCHDLDGDGVCNTNWLGIPTEPVGASRGGRGVLGPPRFSDAVLSLVDDAIWRITVR